MASLALHDVDPEILEKLTLQAKRLGTTIESAALRALRDHLAEQEQQASGAAVESRGELVPDAPSAEALPEDPRFVRSHGIWVFAGKLDPQLLPDHRQLREERIDSFVRAALGENGD